MSAGSFKPVQQVVSIHQRVCQVDGFIAREGQQLAESHDHFSSDVLLVHDARMIFQMCRTCHPAAQLGDVERPSGIVQLSALAQLFGGGEDVDVRTGVKHRLQCGINQLMTGDIKHFRFQQFVNQCHAFFFDQAGSEDGFLEFGCLGL